MNMHELSERLFKTLSHPNFLSMKGLANEVPIFIQTYEPAHEDALRRMVESLAIRLQSAGITLKSLDLFELVLEELEEHKILKGLLAEETTWQRSDVLETLQNYSDPKTHMIPRLIRAIENDGGQLTLITGPGRVLRTARSKRKEIDEMLDSIMKKAEDNSDKFLRERGAIKEVVVPDKKKSVLGKRKKLVVKEEEEVT